jgi:hypothetical protein
MLTPTLRSLQNRFGGARADLDAIQAKATSSLTLVS